MKLHFTFSLLFISVLFHAQTWSYVGNCCIEDNVDNLTSAGSEDLSFLSDGSPVVSYFRQTGSSTTGKVKKFDGNQWVQVGENLPVTGTISAIDIETFGNEIYASVLTGGTQIRVYHYDGNQWELLGEMVNGNLAYEFIMDHSGALYLFTTSDQTIRKYVNSAWQSLITLSQSSSPAWAGDQSIVVDANNHFLFIQPYLNMDIIQFENDIHMFDGNAISPVGNTFYTGLGTTGKLALDNDGALHTQYQSNGTNKICKLEGDTWNQLLDTTNSVNGIFGFKYAFDGNNTMLLSAFTSVYFADGYEALPSLPAVGIPLTINDLVQGPDGKIYITFGELPSGSGSNFSVMTLNQSVDITEQARQNFQLFPNPSNGSFTIPSIIHGDKIVVYDVQGKLVHAEIASSSGMHSMHLSLPSGIYCLVVQNNSTLRTQTLHLK